MAGDGGTIRPVGEAEQATVLEIVNDAARAYEGVIPDDCWREPYMDAAELAVEVRDGVVFFGFERDGRLLGVMGLQDRGEVVLLRHAYVRTRERRSGIGAALLAHLEGLTDRPILVGTWAAASWAISFYEQHGFALVPGGEGARLLRRYWSIPPRQVETSVVLARPPR
ncbi:MAG: GNAT family N-acetyltransferase [Acidimicrobiia bacterium]|nr:GNAT family N-acetyltransferase [Acidimicrobiia bacterium]